MKEKIRLSVLASSHRKNAILGFLCATVLTLTICGAGREMAEPARSTPRIQLSVDDAPPAF